MKKDLLCVIANGVPGSGKSQYVRQHFAGAPVYSADHIFERKGGYDFDHKILDLAHDDCFKDVTRECFVRSSPVIVVDNTNVAPYEILPYIRLAEAHGYRIQIVNVVCDPEVAAERCVHGVPKDKVLKMHKELIQIRADLLVIADRYHNRWAFTDYVTDGSA